MKFGQRADLARFVLIRHSGTAFALTHPSDSLYQGWEALLRSETLLREVDNAQMGSCGSLPSRYRCFHITKRQYGMGRTIGWVDTGTIARLTSAQLCLYERQPL